ncbi:MAG: hypothetical protein SGPRY_011325, partial [Prymnesium sp.]
MAAVVGGERAFAVAIAEGSAEMIIERAHFPTTSPDETLTACERWLRARHFDAIGVTCFGPADLHMSSPTYGCITNTSKPGWQGIDVLSRFQAIRPNAPCSFDTDVNGAALAEFQCLRKDANRNGTDRPRSCCYIAFDAGIRVGLVMNGAVVHGLVHPEGGHIAVPRRAVDLAFEGPNPKDCFGGSSAENMCCSSALATRAGLACASELARLSDDDEVWDAAAHYIGSMCASILLVASPEKIILSGDLM